MTGEQFTPDGLDRRVAAIITAESPTEVFKILLEGAGLAAPRAAVYLLRQGGIKGWGTLGFGSEAAQRQRKYLTAADEGWLGKLAATADPLHETDSPGPALEFGQPASDEWSWSVCYRQCSSSANRRGPGWLCQNIEIFFALRRYGRHD